MTSLSAITRHPFSSGILMMKFSHLAYCVSVSCYESNINQGNCFHQKSYNPEVNLNCTEFVYKLYLNSGILIDSEEI